MLHVKNWIEWLTIIDVEYKRVNFLIFFIYTLSSFYWFYDGTWKNAYTDTIYKPMLYLPKLIVCDWKMYVCIMYMFISYNSYNQYNWHYSNVCKYNMYVPGRA